MFSPSNSFIVLITFLTLLNFRDKIFTEAQVITENFIAQRILRGSYFLSLSVSKFIEPNNEMKIICFHSHPVL